MSKIRTCAGICFFIAAVGTGFSAAALTAKQVGTNVYGADQASTNNILTADLDELIQARGAGKVVVYGGVHGYVDTGVPTAAHNARYACGEMAADETAIKKEYRTRYRKEANFNYVNVGLNYPTKGGEFTPKGLNSLYDAITRRATGGTVAYLAWCWAGTWYEHGGGH
jgi:hypothetical protein